jgi:DNA-binding NarL/FixJ family response regulator
MAGDSVVMASATLDELSRAVSALELPLAVWKPDGQICLANEALSLLVGRPVDALVGHSAAIFTEIFSPRAEIETTLAYLGSGSVESIRSHRILQLPGRAPLPLWVWSRMLDVDDGPMGMTVFLPIALLDRSGDDPALLWRELADIGVGIADAEWTVLQVSADIGGILGVPAAHVVGSSLGDWIHPDDRSPVDGAGPGIQRRVRVRAASGEWKPASLIWVNHLDDPNRRFFAMVPVPALVLSKYGDRVADLELRLRRIGAEVQAAGVLDGLGSVPALETHPKVAELTTRQWDIVTRLVKGESAQTIARELFLSPSTVRNHLSAIYRKLGIHSQVELVRMFA